MKTLLLFCLPFFGPIVVSAQLTEYFQPMTTRDMKITGPVKQMLEKMYETDKRGNKKEKEETTILRTFDREGRLRSHVNMNDFDGFKMIKRSIYGYSRSTGQLSKCRYSEESALLVAETRTTDLTETHLYTKSSTGLLVQDSATKEVRKEYSISNDLVLSMKEHVKTKTQTSTLEERYEHNALGQVVKIIHSNTEPNKPAYTWTSLLEYNAAGEPVRVKSYNGNKLLEDIEYTYNYGADGNWIECKKKIEDKEERDTYYERITRTYEYFPASTSTAPQNNNQQAEGAGSKTGLYISNLQYFLKNVGSVYPKVGSRYDGNQRITQSIETVKGTNKVRIEKARWSINCDSPNDFNLREEVIFELKDITDVIIHTFTSNNTTAKTYAVCILVKDWDKNGYRRSEVMQSHGASKCKFVDYWVEGRDRSPHIRPFQNTAIALEFTDEKQANEAKGYIMGAKTSVQ